MKYVFDTTILVDHLRNVKEAKYLVQKVEKGASLLDCIIAATAFEEKCRVLTLNLKDFQKIEEIEVEKPY